MLEAVRNKQLECAKYIYENGRPILEEELTLIAIKQHDISMLEYLHGRNRIVYSDIIAEAAENDNLDAMVFLRSNGVRWTCRVCPAAVTARSLRCLKYAHENGAPFGDFIVEKACVNNSADCLKYLYEKGVRITIEALARAATNRETDCFEFLLQQGMICDHWTLCQVAGTNNLLGLKVLQRYKVPLIAEMCNMAAMKGHLAMLQSLHRAGCPWDTQTTYKAAINDNLSCLRYAIENKCPISDYVLTEVYIPKSCRKYLDTLKFDQ